MPRFSVAENIANGTLVGTVPATDPDAGDTRSFAITAGNTGGAFAIDPTTGAITIANASALDFEATPSFRLTVEVTDAGGLRQSAAVVVDVQGRRRAHDRAVRARKRLRSGDATDRAGGAAAQRTRDDSGRGADPARRDGPRSDPPAGAKWRNLDPFRGRDAGHVEESPAGCRREPRAASRYAALPPAEDGADRSAAAARGARTAARRPRQLARGRDPGEARVQHRGRDAARIGRVARRSGAGGSLAAAALSSLPLWRRVDPLAVLALSEEERWQREQEMRAAQRDESIGRLLDDGEGEAEDSERGRREVTPDDAG